SVLILTCTGVSFAHGSNDGQKGIGLIMLILIGLVPSYYALDMSQSADKFREVAHATSQIQDIICDPQVEKTVAASRYRSESLWAGISFISSARADVDATVGAPPEDRLTDPDLHTVQEMTESLHNDLSGKTTPGDLNQDLRWQIRTKTLM